MECLISFFFSFFIALIVSVSSARAQQPHRTVLRTATTFVFLILYDGMNNELKEFGPDIRRKVFHKDAP